MHTTTRVILVRHGRSTFNDKGCYQGSSDDAVLTPKGLETARQVGESLRHTPIHAIYTSPLRRVQQTTCEILKGRCASQSPPVKISPHLKEISLSQWEGLTYKYVQQHFSEQYQCWQHQPDQFELPLRVKPAVKSAEAAKVTEVTEDSFAAGTRIPQSGVAVAQKNYFPVRSLYQRAHQFWQQTLPSHLGKTLLVVGHSGTNHALISTALGLHPRHHHSLQQSNCGISQLVFSHSASGQSLPFAQLQQLNQTTSIGEVFPKLKQGKQGLRLLLLASDQLTPEHCQRLADRMAEMTAAMPIDFSLTASTVKPALLDLLNRQSVGLHLTAQDDSFF